jgi:glycosyltransferase involved in cell wall biosynthesis
VGPMPPAALAGEYGRASLFVLPSRSENAPLTVREALAAGVPIVATQVGGVDELVTDGVDGLLVPPGDPVTLAAAIERLLAPAVQARFAAAARARGLELPSWAQAGAAFASACRSIAAL